MSPDALAGIAFTVLCGLLGVIWWEIRGLRKSSHKLANDITALYGRVGLVELRVQHLEQKK